MATSLVARLTRFTALSCSALALSCSGKPASVAPYRAPAQPCAVVLAPSARDPEVARLQAMVAAAPDPVPYLERLGWTFVARARSTHDPGQYTVALETAACIDSRRPAAPEALLLRGHAVFALHRFGEAEAIGRELVARRGAWFDHALLGDALLDQGRVEEAIASYERVMAERPGPQAYSRAAHVRWIMGDVEGAIEAMTLAARASDTRDPSSAAWFRSRLAQYEREAGHAERAEAWIDAALALEPDHPPALLARGLARLAAGRATDAIAPLARAIEIEPTPEYEWSLAEALRAAGRTGDAENVEARLVERGEAEDPRTLALFLATTGRDPARALALAERELASRQDVLTLDVMALALERSGRIAEARSYSDRALARGTRSARLYLHAAEIARAAGDTSVEARRSREARRLAHLLLPSERMQLDALIGTARAHPGHEPGS